MALLALPPWLAGAGGAAVSPLPQADAGGAQSWAQAQASTAAPPPVAQEPAADGAWRCLDRSHAAACARCAASAQPPAAALLRTLTYARGSHNSCFPPPAPSE
jgi:hypothetical protein